MGFYTVCMVSKVDYNFNLLSSLVAISDKSPTGIMLINSNKPVGSFEKDSDGNRKAVRVKIGKTRYLVHRVVWLLHYGSIDSTLDIDHIDGNPWNNLVNNLRLVTKVENQRNRRKMQNNLTGYNGVGIHTTATGSGKYNTYIRACWINLLGKQVHKDFNIKNFETIELAAEFADLYRELQIQDRQTYTERHGK